MENSAEVNLSPLESKSSMRLVINEKIDAVHNGHGKGGAENSEVLAPALPHYLVETYYWAYLNPRHVKQLDRNIVVDVLLFGNARRLIRSYLSEIEEGFRVLQIAHVYGDLVKKISDKVGKKGHFDLFDVAPVQLALGEKKLKNSPNATLKQHDATQPYVGEYDMIGSFFLLHEIPSQEKKLVIQNMLDHVKKNGTKAVFIDYHRPCSFQPIKGILYVVNKWLEPYAYELWNHDIQDLADNAEEFHWQKTTFFAGVYQKVVVTRK